MPSRRSEPKAINADGLGFEGTEGNDTFNLVTDGGYVEVAAGAGNDTFNLTPGDTIRLNFHYGPGTRTGQGIVVDLATGIVSQDGFGGTDRINFLGGTGQLQIHGTDFADRILGSDRDAWQFSEGLAAVNYGAEIFRAFFGGLFGRVCGVRRNH